MLSPLIFISALVGTPQIPRDMAEQLAAIQKEADKLIVQGDLILSPQKGCTARCKAHSEEDLKTDVKAQEEAKLKGFRSDHSPQILIFVSFSMPEASLKALGEAAERHNAILVMRGLYHDSFAQTAHKMKELGLTVDINPALFDTYAITAVPTFIHLKEGQEENRLSGNVTIDFCVRTFQEAS